jgi:hypothetical protein
MSLGPTRGNRVASQGPPIVAQLSFSVDLGLWKTDNVRPALLALVKLGERFCAM